MKKTILILSLVLISILSYSQTYFNSYKSEIGRYNERTDKWVFGNTTFTDIVIMVEKTYVQVDDNAHSLYRIIERMEDVKERNFISWAWKTLDEKNRTCVVQFTHFYGTNTGTMMVIYDGTCIVYTLRKNNNLSPF